MYFLYNLITVAAAAALQILALFSPKMKLFVNGRKDVFRRLEDAIGKNDQVIWFHAASLGEYEQGLPVMEEIRARFPHHKLILTFFSPSGYEVRKNNKVAHLTLYLPLDTAAHARRFIKALRPQMAFFIKYEYWPNYLRELELRRVPTFLISGIFRGDQAFFKWYGGFYRRALGAFTHFFVQNDSSRGLLERIGNKNVTVSGDTRFDRVADILARDNNLEFIDDFKGASLLVVAGSTWPKDEEILVPVIREDLSDTRYVIAPHNIKPDQIRFLKDAFPDEVILYSEMQGKLLSNFRIFIIDTIGILTKIYSYADIAYVGGGFGNPGVHNVLEPAAFGIPVVVGPNYSHFAEASALVRLGGCIPVNNAGSLAKALGELAADSRYRAEKGSICGTFVAMNTKAVDAIMKHLEQRGDIPHSNTNLI